MEDKSLIKKPETNDIGELEKYYEAVVTEANTALQAIRFVSSITTAGTPKNNKAVAVGYKLEMPTAYSNDLTWEKKIYYVISQLKEAFVPEIVDYIIKKEPTLGVVTVKNAVSTKASKLGRLKIIKTKPFGLKYKYYL